MKYSVCMDAVFMGQCSFTEAIGRVKKELGLEVAKKLDCSVLIAQA